MQYSDKPITLTVNAPTIRMLVQKEQETGKTLEEATVVVADLLGVDPEVVAQRVEP